MPDPVSDKRTTPDPKKDVRGFVEGVIRQCQQVAVRVKVEEIVEALRTDHDAGWHEDGRPRTDPDQYADYIEERFGV